MKTFLDELVDACEDVLDSADDTGCSGDVIVVSLDYIKRLAKICNYNLCLAEDYDTDYDS